MDDFDWFSPSTPSLSSPSSSSSTTSSPGLPATPVLFTTSTFPLSPPAPHRKAPSPPTYRPRRPRARHIAMREPARSGLFTVCEFPEEEEHCEQMAPPELEADHSAYATSASESGCTTPGYESEDPFALDDFTSPWRSERVASMFGSEEQEEMGLGLGQGIGLGFGIELSSTFFSRPPAPSKSPRRPPPLNLILDHHPYQLAAPPTPSPSRCVAPKLRPSALLPALPILPSKDAPPAYQPPSSPRTPTRPRRKTNHTRDDDLLLQFAELLESCGEDAASQTYGFPLPPARHQAQAQASTEDPKTPQRRQFPQRSPPPAPSRPRRPSAQATSTNEKVAMWRREQVPPASPTGSHSTTSSGPSRRSLPRRAPIPWECKM